jgi:hypothetical protein
MSGFARMVIMMGSCQLSESEENVEEIGAKNSLSIHILHFEDVNAVCTE